MEREDRRKTDYWFKAALLSLGFLKIIVIAWVGWMTTKVLNHETRVALIERTIDLQNKEIINRLDRMEKKR